MRQQQSKPYLLRVFKSWYCRLVFLVTLVLTFLLMPRALFQGWKLPIASIFLILSAVVVTCTVRNIKERVILARSYQTGFFAIIATGLGLAALQVCGVGAQVCTATIGVALFSLFFPGASLVALQRYAWAVLVLSIVLQIIALFLMRCFTSTKRASQSSPKVPR